MSAPDKEGFPEGDAPHAIPNRTLRRWQRLRRAVVVFLLGALIALASLGFLLTRSEGQTRLALWLAARLLPVELSLTGLEITRQSVAFDALTLHADDRDAPALLEAADFHLSYNLRPRQGRYLNAIALSALTLRYQEDDAGRRNWDALLDAFRGDPTVPAGPPKSFPVTPWLPERIALTALNFEGHAPDWDLSLAPLSLEGRITTPEEFSLYLHGADLEAAWALPRLALPSHSVQGALNAWLARDGTRWALELDAALPTLAEGSMSLQVDAESGEDAGAIHHIALDMPSMAVAAPMVLPLLRPRLPFPVHFTALNLEDTALVGRWQAGTRQVETARLRLKTEELQLGPAEAPWFQGDVALLGAGRMDWAGETQDATGHVDWVAYLGAAPPLFLTTTGGLTEATLDLRANGWERAALLSTLPAHYAAYLDYAPGLVGIESLQLEGVWRSPELVLSGMATPRLQHARDDGDYAVAVDGTLYTDMMGDAPWFDGEIAVQSDQGQMTAATQLSRERHLRADMQLREINPASWLADWLEQPWPEDLRSVLSGLVSYRFPMDEAGAMQELDFDVYAETFHYGDVAFTETTPIQAQGRAGFNATTPLHGQQLHIEQAGNFTAHLAPWRTRYDPFRFSAQLMLEANVPALASYVDFPGLWGNVTAAGPVVYEGSEITSSELVLRSEDFMWGDWSIPYGSELRVQGAMTLDWEGRPQLRIDAAELHMANSQATVAEMLCVFPQGDAPLQLHMNHVLLESDLAPIVRQGWLHAAQGSIRVLTPELRYGDQGLRGAFAVALAAERLVVPESVAAMGGVTLTGDLVYDGAMHGEGVLHLDHLSVGGIVVGATDSTVRFVADDLIIDDLAATLFAGVLEGEATVGVLQPGLPVRIQGEVRDIDLERFTEEFKPPDIFLTGLVNGDLAVTFDENGIIDLRAHLESTENFSLNRDMVEYLLLSEYVGDIGGGRNLERVVRRTVGDAAQRAFDSAVLDLGFENGRITGIAVLESRNLSLTFDIVADPEALIEALKIRQQEAL